MKQLTFILIFIVSITFSACKEKKVKSISKKRTIDIETVDFIEINNKSEQLDSLQINRKILSKKQAIEFLKKWNNSQYKGPIKSAKKYFFKVHLKNGTTRDFQGYGNILKEGNDMGFDIGDSKFIETVWNE